MRKGNLAIALILTTIVALTGCGCNNSNAPGNSSGSQSNAGSSTNPQASSSSKQHEAANLEDFTDDRTFNLDGYAKSLGYTRLEDPKGAVVYAITKNGIKRLFTCSAGSMVCWLDYGDGYTYQTDPVALRLGPEDYILPSNNGGKDEAVSIQGLENIKMAMSHIATTEKIEADFLPGFRAVFKIAGSPKYYPNGVIQEVSGETVETISQREIVEP